jgi:hypothetical protein
MDQSIVHGHYFIWPILFAASFLLDYRTNRWNSVDRPHASWNSRGKWQTTLIIQNNDQITRNYLFIASVKVIASDVRTISVACSIQRASLHFSCTVITSNRTNMSQNRLFCWRTFNGASHPWSYYACIVPWKETYGSIMSSGMSHVIYRVRHYIERLCNLAGSRRRLLLSTYSNLFHWPEKLARLQACNMNNGRYTVYEGVLGEEQNKQFIRDNVDVPQNKTLELCRITSLHVLVSNLLVTWYTKKDNKINICNNFNLIQRHKITRTMWTTQFQFHENTCTW